MLHKSMAKKNNQHQRMCKLNHSQTLHYLKFVAKIDTVITMRTHNRKKRYTYISIMYMCLYWKRLWTEANNCNKKNTQLIFHLKYHEMPITMTSIEWYGCCCTFSLHYNCMLLLLLLYMVTACVQVGKCEYMHCTFICEWPIYAVWNIIKCRLCGRFYVADPITIAHQFQLSKCAMQLLVVMSHICVSMHHSNVYIL